MLAVDSDRKGCAEVRDRFEVMLLDVAGASAGSRQCYQAGSVAADYLTMQARNECHNDLHHLGAMAIRPTIIYYMTCTCSLSRHTITSPAVLLRYPGSEI